ncbi:hypothetical protein F10B_0186 [Escherichia phage vB_EcoM_Gotham]|uniref:Uncharacterized protein n=1 Tax=Escherichia phage vB_EcoM_Gotham TaxID=2750849 RepID=A0A7D5JP12_9CAUD|nr:hypothetical protein F10B_0186 [Escherichia phage vB_EcoM_Gotham]
MGAYLFKKFFFRSVAIRSGMWIITINGELIPTTTKTRKEKQNEQQYPRY